eukprot:3522632-Karenia_brevis.AAC.1
MGVGFGGDVGRVGFVVIVRVKSVWLLGSGETLDTAKPTLPTWAQPISASICLGTLFAPYGLRGMHEIKISRGPWMSLRANEEGGVGIGFGKNTKTATTT